MSSAFNDAYTIIISDFLYKSICCGYFFELPRLVEALQTGLGKTEFLSVPVQNSEIGTD